MPITSWKGVLGEDEYRPKYPDSPFIHIADLVNHQTGKTFREENAEKKHAIPIGALVEVVGTDARLFVVHHGRDCDMTPLYELCADKDDIEQREPGFRNRGWVGGYSEDSLAIIHV